MKIHVTLENSYDLHKSLKRWSILLLVTIAVFGENMFWNLTLNIIFLFKSKRKLIAWNQNNLFSSNFLCNHGFHWNHLLHKKWSKIKMTCFPYSYQSLISGKIKNHVNLCILWLLLKVFYIQQYKITFFFTA